MAAVSVLNMQNGVYRRRRVVNRVMLNGEAAESAMQILRRQLEGDIFGVAQLERKQGSVHARFHRFK